MLAFRDWTIKRWGARQYAKLENRGNVAFGSYIPVVSVFKTVCFVFVMFFVFSCRCGRLRAKLWQADAGLSGGAAGFFLTPQGRLTLLFSGLPTQPSAPLVIVVLVLLSLLVWFKRHSKTKRPSVTLNFN